MLVSTISPAPRPSTSRAHDDGLCARRYAAAVNVDLPDFAAVLPDPLGVDVDHDALAAESPCGLADKFRVAYGRRVDRHLVGPRAQQGPDIIEVANPAANGQRHEANLGRAAHDFEQNRAVFVAGGDVEEDQFIGSLVIIARSHFDRIAGVFQIEEICPLDHAPVVDIEARDDPLGQHAFFNLLACSGDAERHNIRPTAFIVVTRVAPYSIEEQRAILEVGRRENSGSHRVSTPVRIR